MIVYQPVYFQKFADDWHAPFVFHSYEDAQAYIKVQQQTTWRKGDAFDYWLVYRLELS